MSLEKQIGPAGGSHGHQRGTEGSASRTGAEPAKKELHRRPKRKLPPVPIAVAFQRTKPDTQIWAVMALLSNGPRWVSMPELSDRSGSLNIHSVVSAIRRRFRWIIENDKRRHGKDWHSKFRLFKPEP